MSAGAASSEMLESLRQSLPSHRFSGDSSRINHKQIELLGNLIDSAGIADKIEEWQDLDRVKRGPGGRPRLTSTRTVLILLLVLSTENSPLLTTRLAILTAERLSGKSRRYLGIDGIFRTHREWYFPLWRALKRTISAIDPQPGQRTNHDPGTPPGHPLMIAGMGMTIPGKDLIATGRSILQSIADRGHPIGRATGDRGYAASASPEDYQIPLRRLGYKIYTDYRDNQLGKKEGYGGAIQVEGAFYCPSMPKNLIEATIQYRAGAIDHKTWRNRIKERRQYMLRAKEKPDAAGRVPMMCPARGPGATASCPLVTGGCGKPDDAKTTIRNPPPENKRDSICKNAFSVSFPVEAAAKFIQDVPYGSDEWKRVYSTDRNTIEGHNGFLKDGSHEAIADGTRRRIRGYAGQYFFIGILVVTGNLRKLQAFRDEMLEGTDEQRRLRRERKLAARARRKARKDRVTPWDNFSQRQKAEKAEAEAAAAAASTPESTSAPRSADPPHT